MARFFGEIKGKAGEATRLGSASSGLRGHLRGWNIGARVLLAAYGETDSVNLAITEGSSGYGSDLKIGYATIESGRIVFYPSQDLCAALGIKYYVHNQGVGSCHRRAILKGN